MKAGGDQELCLAASPEGSYLFRPAVPSLLQPSGLDSERSAFAFASPPTCDTNFCQQSWQQNEGWKKRPLDKKRHVAHVQPLWRNMSLNSASQLAFISVRKRHRWCRTDESSDRSMELKKLCIKKSFSSSTHQLERWHHIKSVMMTSCVASVLHVLHQRRVQSEPSVCLTAICNRRQRLKIPPNGANLSQRDIMSKRKKQNSSECRGTNPRKMSDFKRPHGSVDGWLADAAGTFISAAAYFTAACRRLLKIKMFDANKRTQHKGSEEGWPVSVLCSH